MAMTGRQHTFATDAKGRTYATYFVPANEREHERGNAGEDVPDYCRNCRRPFMAHTNGRCPKS